MDVEEVIIHARSARSPLIVTGQIDDEGRKRLGVLDVAARPRVVLDEWLAAESVLRLTQTLDAPVGRWDVMHSTSWKYAWAAGKVWDARGIRAHVVAPKIIDLRRLTGGFNRVEVKNVRGVLSEGWLVRSVNVVDERGREHIVARRRELSVLLDPLYDQLDVWCDASWTAQMATALAGALCVDLYIDEALS